MSRGLEIEEALMTELNHRPDGVQTQSELARGFGMSRQRMHQILNRAGLNGGDQPPDWDYIDKRGLREYAATIGIIEEESK